MKRSFWKNCIIGITACLFLIAVYCLAQVIVGNPLVFPSFSDSVKAFFDLLGQSAFYKALSRTLLRVLIAFFVSFAPALGLAIVSYLYPTLGRFFAPVVSVLRSLPTLAVLLIILSWTSAGTAPIVVAFLTLFPALYSGILASLKQTDKGLIEVSKTYGVPLNKRIVSLYLPASAPYVLRESASALSLSLKLVASAEVLASTAVSLGGLMQDAKLYFATQTPTLFALVGATFIVGLALESIVYALANCVERRVK